MGVSPHGLVVKSKVQRPGQSTTARMSSSDMIRYSSPSTVTSLPAYDVNSTRSPSLTWKGARLPLSRSLPSPTLSTLPCLGFSLALSGSTMPPAVRSSASSRLTTILSFRGTTFMSLISQQVKTRGFRLARYVFAFFFVSFRAVDPNDGPHHRVDHD